MIPQVRPASTFGLSCSPKGYLGPSETITLGYHPSESAGLVYIAEEKGFFAANGVSFIYKHYDTGAKVMDALVRNEVDIAGVAEVPFISRIFEKEKVSVYGIFAKVQYTYLVALKERNIRVPSELKGKKIGLPRRTIAEFYLGRR